ncbi:hypothetical protein MB901379_04210 [Mycobacterium basiliense]|uniref:Uncharacterized protein n=1 Tax=Mycobacterium basiliense TaxID=2094119 RepID=A0A3S4BL41_9MYCO|nr:hypothetical protein [Mycobacterium basiliense]VDM90608.1 hypothetical protein MB901379_04210 [Mycobacterium basiliense]
MASTTSDMQSTHPGSTGPTSAATWLALSGRPIDDALLEWPPDLFALTDVILGHTQVYRFVFSPPGDVTWPPGRVANWAEAVAQAGRDWSSWVGSRGRAVPDLVAQEWAAFREHAQMPLEHLAEGRSWRMCEALLTLHAIADEACAGLGVPLGRSNETGFVYRARGRELLARTGSLARIHPHLVRVLPKVRTSPKGTSLGSFSRYACVHRPGAEVRWSKIPARHRGTNFQADYANVLLLPWPLRVRESDFHPVEGSVCRLATEPFGYFEFAPAERLDLDLVDRTVMAARDEVGGIDVVVFPESAVDEGDIDDLEAVLDHHGVTMLMTGVRQPMPQSGRLPGNWVHIGVSPELEKRSVATGSNRQRWFHVRQNKHHRWSLNESQIFQYHLGGALHPHILWWEAMDVARRTVQFVELGEELTLVCLVCEDLAQRDDVADVVRSVGPTLVFTPLLDGPQLTSRWAARYASVLADDPGSAVATLSAYGMVQRCRPAGQPSSSVVGLWKDPVRGIREVPLEAGAHGVVLTICGDRALRRTADSRPPIGDSIHYFDVAVHQIHAAPTSLESRSWQPDAPLPPALDIEDLTILTGWAQAVAEALACAPDQVLVLLAEARPDRGWRAALKIAEPSAHLGEAVKIMDDVVRKSIAPPVAPTLEAVIAAMAKDSPGETILARLVRGVLRSTLEQRRARQTRESDR